MERLGSELEQGVHRGAQRAQSKAPADSELGIQISDERVEIDLNRTRHFMQQWIEAVKVFGEELNRSLAPLRH